MKFLVRNQASLTVLLGSLLAAACGSDRTVSTESSNETGASTDPIVDLDHTAVKRQTIGNCWVYATTTWAESLHKSVAGEDLNLSESYVSYWHWFEQIANRRVSAVSTGGTWATAVDLMSRYGIMNEADFISEEATEERSLHQSAALKAINESLKTGALSTAAARADRATIRAELDRVFGLHDDVKAQLDTAFGAGVVRTLDRSPTSVTGTKVLTTRSISVRTTDPRTHAPVTATLADVVRGGRYSWQGYSYPSDAFSRRQLWKRVQRAMHDKLPVVISWRVDFNALDATGNFAMPPSEPGRQGGHLVVVEDYEIDNVPGYGTLAAGTVETRPAALAAALDDTARVRFIRIKNSWGSMRAGPALGYNDLYLDYLNGPVKQCEVDADDEPLTPFADHCWDAVPLNAVTLPAGY